MSNERKFLETEIGLIPIDWTYQPLEYFFDWITYGFTNPMPTTEEGPNMITAKDINNGRILFESSRKTSKEAFENLLTPKSRPKINDILITKDGSIGRVGIVDRENFCINQSVALIRPNQKKINPLFLKYLLESPGYQKLIERDASGSTIQHIYITRINKMLIGVPEIKEQEKIVHIIHTLSQKIELNRQMNQTLEAMAQALFKSWFVDFDPVIDNALAQGNPILEELQARAEKRKSLSDSKKLFSTNPTLAAQFPASFVFNETLGKWIPEGWEVKRIEDIVKVGSAKRIFANEYKTFGIPFFRGREITLLSQGNNFESEIYISKERFAELRMNNGVPKKDDILLTSVGTIGNTYLVEEEDEFYFKDGNLTWFTNYNTGIGGKYLKTWFDSEEAVLAIDNIKIGSTQQAITITSINSIKLILAHEFILAEFNELLKSFISDRQLRTKEIKTLTKLRDRLLPELISGRVRVKEG